MRLIAKLTNLLQKAEREQPDGYLPELLRVAIEAARSLDEDDRPSLLWDAVDALSERVEAV